jgi:hypothetical protein
MTAAQQKLLDQARLNEGWLEVNGSSQTQVARRLEAAGYGKIVSAFTDKYGKRRLCRHNGCFFVLNETK